MPAISPYLSFNSLGTLNFDNYWVSPYEEGAQNLKIAFSSDTRSLKLDLLQRIKNLVLGILLLIPLVNTIVFVALRTFAISELARDVPKNHMFSRKLVQSPTNILEEALKELGDIKKKHKIVEIDLELISEFFTNCDEKGNVILDDASHNHLLHAYVTSATRSFLKLQNEKIKTVWKKFLTDSEKHIRLIYPDQKIRKLDFSRQQALLSNPVYKPKIIIRKVNDLSKQDLKEIREIEYESFTLSYPSQLYINFAQQKNKSALFLAKENEQTVGTLCYSGGHIYSLARRANATSLGIGHSLFKTLALSLEKQTEKPKALTLQVRKSNTAAIKLYKSLGFNVMHTVPNYYSMPSEDAYYMSVPYKTFAEKASTII